MLKLMDPIIGNKAVKHNPQVLLMYCLYKPLHKAMKTLQRRPTFLGLPELDHEMEEDIPKVVLLLDNLHHHMLAVPKLFPRNQLDC
jgi:hypothetical protein